MATANNATRFPGQPEHTGTELVFSRHIDSIYRFLYRQVGNAEDAEELTSHVFRRVGLQVDAGQSETTIASSLVTLARSVLADHWSRWYRRPVPANGANGPEHARTSIPTDAPPIGNREGGACSLLAALPECDRHVLELRFLEGQSIEDSAAALGITPDAARAIEHRALQLAVQVYEADLSPQ